MAGESEELKKLKSKDQETILEVARARFKLAAEAEQRIRDNEIDDLKFLSGDQWPEDIKQARDLDRRPCLTINRLPQYVRQITNDQRQNRPAIKVSPVDDKGDVEVAKVYQGLIRHIEYNSNADVAYDTGFEGAAAKGRGYWRVITDYADPQSFELDILIKRIRNSLSVYVDPHYQEPDGSDMSWAFIIENMPKDDYLAQHKDSELASMDDWESIGDRAPGWASGNTVRVAEYFYKTYEDATLCLLSNGETIVKGSKDYQLPEGVSVIQERKTQIPKVKWLKINAVEILEETDWPGRWIPIVPVLGNEIDLDGERILEGVIRHAKDPQRMYNYWVSSETETIALAPRAPFIGAEGQFEGHEHEWATANQKNHAFLQYRPKTIGGQMVSPPQRQVFEAPVQAITQARALSSDDLKATTGIFDAALGNQSNESSGIAIQRRNQQSQTSNFHFIDNLTRAIKHTGRILVDLIPKVYDSPRTVRIIGEDGEEKIVAINQIFEEKGEAKIFDLGHGKYDVTVSTGPSYATKRQEALESMLAFIQAYPDSGPIIGDLIAKNMDWHGSEEIAERLKKSLPPQFQEPEEGEAQPLPPEAQQQFQQMDQMIQQLTEALEASNKTLDEKRIELESKERIEFAKMETDLEKEKLKQAGAYAIESVNAQIADIERRLALLNIESPFQQHSQPEPGGQMMPPEQMGDPNIDPNFNGAGFDPAGIEQEQLTGEFSPGPPMGDM